MEYYNLNNSKLGRKFKYLKKPHEQNTDNVLSFKFDNSLLLYLNEQRCIWTNVRKFAMLYISKTETTHV